MSPFLPKILDPSFRWEYVFSFHIQRDLYVIDDAFVDSATLNRLSNVTAHAAHAVRWKLNGKKSSALNLLKVRWPRDVFCKLLDDFQLDHSGLESEPTVTGWSSFLSVALNEFFFNFASYSEIYFFKGEYGDTNDLLP